MSQSQFSGGLDLLPGPQGPPIPANALRIVTIGGALFTTIDGLTFTSIAGNVPLATPSAAGLMSAQQAGSLGPLVSAVSPIADFTVNTAAASFIVPLQRTGGWYFSPLSYSILLLGGTGTATGALTVSAGNDSGHTNAAPSANQIDAATINIIQAAGPIIGNSGTFGSGTLIDASTEIKYKVVGATGSTTLAGRLLLTGIWVPTT